MNDLDVLPVLREVVAIVAENNALHNRVTHALALTQRTLLETQDEINALKLEQFKNKKKSKPSRLSWSLFFFVLMRQQLEQKQGFPSKTDCTS